MHLLRQSDHQVISPGNEYCPWWGKLTRIGSSLHPSSAATYLLQGHNKPPACPGNIQGIKQETPRMRGQARKGSFKSSFYTKDRYTGETPHTSQSKKEHRALIQATIKTKIKGKRKQNYPFIKVQIFSTNAHFTHYHFYALISLRQHNIQIDTLYTSCNIHWSITSENTIKRKQQ